MVYFQQVWADPSFLCILVLQLVEKCTKSLVREDLRKRQGRRLKMYQNFREKIPLSKRIWTKVLVPIKFYY